MATSSFLLPFRALKIHSPIDGVARAEFFFRFGIAKPTQLSCLVPFFNHLRPEREKNLLNIETPIDSAEGGNRTQAASELTITPLPLRLDSI